jgi:hypothetical protein
MSTHKPCTCEQRVTTRAGDLVVCTNCGGKVNFSSNEQPNSDILPQKSDRQRRIDRAKRKLLQGRAMIDEALRELEELAA